MAPDHHHEAEEVVVVFEVAVEMWGGRPAEDKWALAAWVDFADQTAVAAGFGAVVEMTDFPPADPVWQEQLHRGDGCIEDQSRGPAYFSVQK